VIAVNPTVTTVYSVTGTYTNGCASTIPFTQSVAPCIASAYAAATQTNVSCRGRNDGRIAVDTIKISYPQYTLKYLWSPRSLCPTDDCNSVDSLKAGTYSVSVVFTYTVATNVVRVDTFVVTPKTILDINDPCDLKVFTGITPNGDGINDAWQITNIELYPKNKVFIFNRWGVLISEIKSYDNIDRVWPDKKDYNRLPASTYFYIIELGDGSKPIKGWLELMKEE
jgi:gliding motility-associated-like protein